MISHLAGHATDYTDDRNLEVRNITETNQKFSYIKNVNRRKYAGKTCMF